MRRRVLLGSAFLLGLLLSPRAALADGIELPRIVRPTIGGGYVVRVVVVTNNNVPGLQIGAFRVNPAGAIGDPIPDALFRPATLNTRAGEKARVLLMLPAAAVPTEQLAAVCMWRDPPTAVGSQSQLLAMFRYCRLFTVKP